MRVSDIQSDIESDVIVSNRLESRESKEDFLKTVVGKQAQSAVGHRAILLRAAMGVRTHRSHSAESTPEPGYCTVDGCRIAWEEIPGGDKSAQPVVCLHSSGTGSREFRPLFDRCPVGSRLILIDWPGHGRSGDMPQDATGVRSPLTVEYCAKIVERVLDQLGVQLGDPPGDQSGFGRPILLGSGFGAAVAIRFASDHPDYVLGLVLCQPAGLVTAGKASPFSQRGKRGVRRLLARMQGLDRNNPASNEKLAARRQALRMEALRTVMQPLRREARESLERAAPGLRQAVESLTCPVLFALSHDSREYPLRSYMKLLDPSLAWATHHQFAVLPGGFNPIWDEPERFSIALAGFIQAQVPIEKHRHAWLLSAVDWPARGTNLWKCVHPDCEAERVLLEGLDANSTPGRK
jgi:pimeloyl-ACP methyl ester carboxylesterase